MSKLNILFKIIFIVIFIYLMTACAYTPLSIIEKQPPRKVAILSELDSHMNKIMIGATIADKTSTQSKISLGDINHSIENDLALKLWSKGTEVLILETASTEIIQVNKKLHINQNIYKGASLVVIVRPIYQKKEYPSYLGGYGVVEKNTLGVKQRLLYASIIYEVYSTKDGNRKAYYVTHPKNSEIIKLNRDVSFEKLTESEILAYKPQLYILLDQINTNALKKLGLN